MNSIKCPQCGLINWATVEACKRCGAQFAEASGPVSQASRAESGQQGQHAHEGWTGSHQSSAYSGHDKQGTQSAFNEAPRTNYYYDEPEVKKSSGQAMASLVLGIIGFFTFGVLGIGALVGTVLGIVALKKARKNPARYGGEGLAIGGIITNLLSFVMVVPLAIIMAIAIPNLLAARRAANEASALRMLRVIGQAESVYQATAGRGNYGTLEELRGAQLINEPLATGTKNGYRFDVRTRPMIQRDRPASYEVVATPVTYGPSGSGVRSFFIDESGIIRAADKRGLEANADDMPINNLDYRTEIRRD
jgi:type II secretory pathway pseudopilin PulG